MCFVCMERYTGRFFMIGADNIHYCCAICGGFGKLVVCSMLKCGLSYCYECLDNLGSTGLRPYIANMAVWICFVCNSTGHSRSGRYIQCRADWRNHLHALFNTHKGFPIPRILLKKERLRVLSLFDGIATGLLALNQLDVNVESYFAAELDYNAKMIALKHHDEKIQYLGNGDVRKINARVLADILPIHLVLGGSPCNDLSRANPDRKGLFDPDGTGVLFYEFSRIITTLKQIGNQAFFWLFENVASMPEEVKSIISRILECQPSQINAYPCVSPQDRKRYFWGNCPSLHVDFSYDGKHVLQDYLDPGRTAAVDHIRTITTNSNSLLQGSIKQHAVYDENMELAPLTIKEIEKIFGLPQDYTQFDTLSKSARLTLVGRAWSVQTICMLLHFVKYFYRLNRDKVLHYD
ncbi:DNA (cytosine-5)-methyltransferase 3B-like [Atheta coriaria]|uniref:DNA (cytosine-5)-methyltransferase 3B-like n=1 Tax=Dalotia coriaria TaxID=877792 RepID=UPI0031F3E5F9